MPVGIDAVARIGLVGSELRQRTSRRARDVEYRQAEVELVSVVRRSSSHRIETDGRWIEAAIFREEPFSKAVPAEPGLVDDRRVHRADVRDRHQLYARRHRGVVSGQEAAAGQSKRKALIGVADVVATGEQVVAVNILIELDDRAIHTVGERRRHDRIGAAIGVAIHRRIGGGRPRLTRTQQILNHRIDSAGRGIRRDVGGGRNAREAALGALFAHGLVIDEEKGLVFLQGAAQGAAKLVVVERLLRAVGLSVEVISRIQHRVAKEFQPGPVPIIGAAFGDDVDHRASATAVFGLEVGGDAQFGNRFHRQNRRRRAENACFVDGGVVAVAIVHVRAIEQEIVGAPAGTVHGKGTVGAG